MFLHVILVKKLMKIRTKSNFSSQKRIYFGKREGRAGGYGAALMMAINALHVEQKAIEETGKGRRDKRLLLPSTKQAAGLYV